MFPKTPQFINPIKRVGGYLGNVAKEAKQYGSAWVKSYDASAGIGPGADRAAYNANIAETQAKGQLLGAVLQGRRYTESGKQVTAPKSEPNPVVKRTSEVVTPKSVTTVVAPSKSAKSRLE